MTTERFTCPVCGASSSHPDDLKNGYCGRCHEFTAEPVPDAGIEGLFTDLIHDATEQQQQEKR